MGKYEDALKYEIFKKEEYKILLPFLSSAKIIFDIGGHWGFFSERCFSKGFSGEIYFFEPIKHNFQKAKENLNPFEKNMHFYEAGVSHNDEKKCMYFNEEKTMQSSESKGSFLCMKGKEEICDFLSLENLIYSEIGEPESIDIMKIDIEGAEFTLFEKIKPGIFSNIKCIFLEYHELMDDWKKENLIEKLHAHYKNIQIIESRYTKKLGYIMAVNRGGELI